MYPFVILLFKIIANFTLPATQLLSPLFLLSSKVVSPIFNSLCSSYLLEMVPIVWLFFDLFTCCYFFSLSIASIPLHLILEKVLWWLQLFSWPYLGPQTWMLSSCLHCPCTLRNFICDYLGFSFWFWIRMFFPSLLCLILV